MNNADHYASGANGSLVGDPNNWAFQEGLKDYRRRQQERYGNANANSGGGYDMPTYNVQPIEISPEAVQGLMVVALVVGVIVAVGYAILAALGIAYNVTMAILNGISALRPVYGGFAMIASLSLGVLDGLGCNRDEGDRRHRLAFIGMLLVEGVGMLGAFPSDGVTMWRSLLGGIGVFLLFNMLINMCTIYHPFRAKALTFAALLGCIYYTVFGFGGMWSPHAAAIALCLGLFGFTGHLIGAIRRMRFDGAGHAFFLMGWLACLVAGAPEGVRIVLTALASH